MEVSQKGTIFYTQLLLLPVIMHVRLNDYKVLFLFQQMSWKEQEQLLKSAQTTMEAKVQELQKQNRMVHEELEAVSVWLKSGG